MLSQCLEASRVSPRVLAPAGVSKPMAESTVAGFLVPGLFIVELQRVPYADPLSSLGTRVSDIVTTAAHNLKGADLVDVRLMAAYIMDRRAHDGSDGGAHAASAPSQPASCSPTYLSIEPDDEGDICTLLCVASTRSGGSSHWVGLDMQRSRESACPRGRRPRRGRKWFSISVAPASLIGCFTRHASIDGSGNIQRREADAAGCTTCARTWSGFDLVIARARSRERVNAARLAALTAASLQARRSFRNEAGIVDVLCAGVVAIKEVESLMQRTDPRLVRAERALSVLAKHIEGALMVCLWAERFQVMSAMLIIAEADTRAATALPESAPRLRHAVDVLDSVVDVAVAAGVIIARANIAASEAICAASKLNAKPLAFTTMGAVMSSLSLGSVLDNTETDMAKWACRASACFNGVRKAAAEVALMNDTDAHANSDLAPAPDSPALVVDTARQDSCAMRGNIPAQARDLATRPSEPAIARDAAGGRDTTNSVPNCISESCRVPERRITSGCVVTAHCADGCAVTFHRACWEAASVVLDDGTAHCRAPDCRASIVRVTSVRLRAVDRPSRIIWQAPDNPPACDPSPQASATRQRQKQQEQQHQCHQNAERTQPRHGQQPDIPSPHHQVYRMPSPHAVSTIPCRGRQCERLHGRQVQLVPRASLDTHDLHNHCPRLPTSRCCATAPDHAGEGRNADTDLKPAEHAPDQETAASSRPDPVAPPASCTETALPDVKGVPYQKSRAPREPPPLKRKRPRDRTGRRQRCHMAAQQRHRLLVMAGLADPAPGDAPAPDGAVNATPSDCPVGVVDDDALWPCFFVPDAVQNMPLSQ